jgi:Ser/Thr protein kinase RdoA (MazF antagonist)
VGTPALVAVDRPARTLTFEAVDGEPLGPKFPADLSGSALRGLLDLTSAMARYRPRRRWLRRFPLERRLRIHVSAGVLSADDAELVRLVAGADRTRWSFAHGDITARNVLRRPDGALVLIDWEWAGLHPPLYDLAFLWFSLADDPGARAVVAATVPADQRRRFLVSVVLIESLHLNMWQDRGGTRAALRDRHVGQHRLDLAALRRLHAPAGR